VNRLRMPAKASESLPKGLIVDPRSSTCGSPPPVAMLTFRKDHSAVVVVRLAAVLLVGSLAVAGAGLAGRAASDPPLLVPWHRIGDISLGRSRALVEGEFGRPGHGYHVIQRYGNVVQGYYVLHRSRVIVTFYGDRVGELTFTTPYYRTKSGFGVGSTIPLGPCHVTATSRCEHRWRGFIYNPTLRETPCGCWVKIGTGARSLRPLVKNFEKPWFFIYLSGGRVSGFYFALKYID
jgi:hypothetical protein